MSSFSKRLVGLTANRIKYVSRGTGVCYIQQHSLVTTSMIPVTHNQFQTRHQTPLTSYSFSYALLNNNNVNNSLSKRTFPTFKKHTKRVHRKGTNLKTATSRFLVCMLLFFVCLFVYISFFYLFHFATSITILHPNKQNKTNQTNDTSL